MPRISDAREHRGPCRARARAAGCDVTVCRPLSGGRRAGSAVMRGEVRVRERRREADKRERGDEARGCVRSAAAGATGAVESDRGEFGDTPTDALLTVCLFGMLTGRVGVGVSMHGRRTHERCNNNVRFSLQLQWRSNTRPGPSRSSCPLPMTMCCVETELC